MTTHRTGRETKKYENHLKNITAARPDICEFCEIAPGHPQFVAQTKHFKVMRTLFRYSLWDDHGVADHLMIVPKVHIGSISDLPPETATEFLGLLSEYEKNGYNIYARAPQSKRRSILHQHTHLIKITDKQRKFIFFMHRPHIRLVR